MNSVKIPKTNEYAMFIQERDRVEWVPRMDIPYYIHNLDPVLLHVAGPLAVRWYGLAYLAGFFGGYQLLRYFSRSGEFRVPESRVGDFVVMLAVYGVLVGGRLGYVLFYGFQDLLSDPLYVFRLWGGGMASHGGIIGVGLWLLYYARRHGLSFFHLCDYVSVVVPVGLFFGRLANFINGELWGRVTEVWWAVIFPMEAGLDYLAAKDSSLIQSALSEGLLAPRHPSQLYQAFGEGVVLFAILWWIRMRPGPRGHGVLTGCFCIFYGVIRCVTELFREPDSTVYFGWLTKGQGLSVALILVGVAVLISRRNAPSAQ